MRNPTNRAVCAIAVGVALMCAAPVVYAQAEDDDLLGGLSDDSDDGTDDLFDDPDSDPDPDSAEADGEDAGAAVDEADAGDAGDDDAEQPAVEEISAAAPEASAPEPEEEAAPDRSKDPRLMDRIKAVPRKPVIKRLRAELTPVFSTSVNDPFFRHLAVGGSLLFYPHDNFALGITGLYMFAHVGTDNIAVVRQSQTSVLATFEAPDAFATFDLYWVPVYGKISLFDSAIVHFDLYAVNGFGAAMVGERTPALMAPGIGQRFVVNDWLALRFEMRDYLYLDTQEVNTQPRSDTQSFLMFQAGLSVFIPPSFEYSGF